MTITVRNIKGFDGYAISRCGMVYSWKTKRWLKQSTQSKGYKQVCLSVDNKQYMKLTHRLVAETYIPNPLGLPEINHKDEIKSNNHESNLEWCDRLTNASHSIAKSYRLQSPSGYIVEIHNLSRFTKQNNINKSYLYRGKVSKGWKLIVDK